MRLLSPLPGLFIFKAVVRPLAATLHIWLKHLRTPGWRVTFKAGLLGGHLQACCSLAQPHSPARCGHPIPAAHRFRSKVLGSSPSQGPVRFLPESLSGLQVMLMTSPRMEEGKDGIFCRCHGGRERRKQEEKKELFLDIKPQMSFLRG